jgi:hypothetical protein
MTTIFLSAMLIAAMPSYRPTAELISGAAGSGIEARRVVVSVISKAFDENADGPHR